MALLDLSLVTRALTSLIELSFKASPIWSSPGNLISPAISPQPPDQLKKESIGLYLYHVSEDTKYKNLPSPGNDYPPVRYTPMGLNLFYQLTAHSTEDLDTGSFIEQKMLGIAIKALHDYPIIDENTKITDLNDIGNYVFTDELKGKHNKFRIVLQPIEYRDAISYWTAGSSPLRLAVYYQVSVVILEPEESKTRSGRVLQYGVQTFIGGAPRINGCKNTISFNVPNKPEVHEVELSPAQVPPGQGIILSGTGFGDGTVHLLLKNNNWKEIPEVDSLWDVKANDQSVTAIVQETITTATETFRVLPGIYSAIVQVTKTINLPDGSTRDIEHSSNECPFMISPTIDSISTPASISELVTIKGYIFKNSAPALDPVKLYIGGNALSEVSATPKAGEFNITDEATIELMLPSDLKSKDYYPVRIFVNGSESPPNWIKVP
jgi:hypothetical protein